MIVISVIIMRSIFVTAIIVMIIGISIVNIEHGRYWLQVGPLHACLAPAVSPSSPP